MKPYDRKIRNEDDPVLDEIWAGLAENIDDGSGMPGNGIEDLRGRIRKVQIRRRRKILALSSTLAAAAVAAAVYFPLRENIGGSHPDTPVAQLKALGVIVTDEQVSLKMDNDISLSLADSASFRTEEDMKTSIVRAPGVEVAVGSERMMRVEVPAGKQFSVSLSDGTTIWMNAESVLEYPASFEGKAERIVRLSGEACFDVAENKTCPFIVELDNGESIRVLGTTFNVNAYPDNENNVTTLVSGRISYRHDASCQDIILNPDQQISTGKTDGKPEIKKVEAESAIDWKGGIITFDNEKLPALAKRLSRMYGIEIVVAEHLEDHAFSGRISYDKGVDFITKLIGETSGIECEIRDGRIVLN